GATKVMLVVAPVASTASFTVLNTGRPWCLVPPLPGVTPPTTLEPYSTISLVWKEPLSPVMPWTMIGVFSSIRMLIGVLPARLRCRPCGLLRRVAGLDGRARGFGQGLGGDQLQSTLGKDLAALLDIGSRKPHHERYLHVHRLAGLHHALGHPVAAIDAGE